jgi:hypothetical protein
MESTHTVHMIDVPLSPDAIADSVAACGPFGVKATLAAAHIAMNDAADPAAYAKLEADPIFQGR